MVSVALHGEDPEYLEDLAGEVEQRFRGVEGVIEVYGPTLRGQKEVRVLVDPDRARASSLEPRQVADAVGFLFRGRRLRRYHRESGEVEVVLGLPEDAELGLDALRDVPITRDDGETVPLSSVAEVLIARIPPEIRREDRKTTSWINAQFDEEKYTTEESQEIIGEAMKGFVLPEGYSWDFGNWGRDRDDTLSQMLTGVLLSLLIVMLLMAALFESVLQPLAILITLPLAFCGAFWSLWFFGYELDPVGFIGVIILIGIVVNNGIVLVDHINGNRRTGLSLDEAIVRGCEDRLRPILMTAGTTILGLLPLAVLHGAHVGDAEYYPMARAISGGLASSTLLTLLVMPTYYRLATLWSARITAGLRLWTGRPRPGDLEVGSEIAESGG
jgi:HAE1 family hydrophobic/amphiphilic exporter-1